MKNKLMTYGGLGLALFVATGVPIIWNEVAPTYVFEPVLGFVFFLLCATLGFGGVVMFLIGTKSMFKKVVKNDVKV